MKLKTLFFILSFLLVSIWVILLAVSFSEKSFMFYITEAIITISLIVLMYFYRKVITPLNSIAMVWTCCVNRISAVACRL